MPSLHAELCRAASGLLTRVLGERGRVAIYFTNGDSRIYSAAILGGVTVEYGMRDDGSRDTRLREERLTVRVPASEFEEAHLLSTWRIEGLGEPAWRPERIGGIDTEWATVELVRQAVIRSQRPGFERESR